MTAMADWNMLVEHGLMLAEGPMIGAQEADLREPFDGVDMAPEEIDRAVEQAARDAGASGVDQLPRAMVVPLYSELADLCGSPAATVIYARNLDGETTALLDQYIGVEPVSRDAVTEGVIEAWQLRSDELVTYIWSSTTTPEVFQIASIAGASECSFASVVAQVSVERGE